MPRTFDILVRSPRLPLKTTRHGVGTAVKRILRERFHAEPGVNCPCNGRIAEMDAKGLDWCRDHRDEIVGWLVEGARVWQAEQRGVFRLWTSMIPEMAQRWYVERLVDEAIATVTAAEARAA